MTSHAIAAALGATAAALGATAATIALLTGGAGWSSKPAVGIIGQPVVFAPCVACQPGMPCLIIKRR